MTPEPKREVVLPMVLRLLGTSERSLSSRELRTFSGMARNERELFWPTWQQIGAERRTEIARSMVELAEDSVELDFGELWYWLLDDQTTAVRVAAVEGMWEDETPRALRRMIELLQHDAAPDVRAAAALALSRFGYKAALGELEQGEDELRASLLATLHDEQQPLDVRRRALESAGYFADDASVQQQIDQAYRSKEQLLRESALTAMGHSMQPRYLPVITQELGSPSPALRYEAAHAAGELADEARALVPQMLPLTEDADSEVALAAIWALGQIGGPAARRALERLSKSRDETRSQAAEEALTELNLEEMNL